MYCQWLDNMGAQTEHAKTVNKITVNVLFFLAFLAESGFR